MQSSRSLQNQLLGSQETIVLRNQMRAALVVNPVTRNWKTNLTRVVQMIHEAAGNCSNLVLLGEMAVTGMVNNDDPLHDLPLGETIPGSVTNRLSETALRLGIWLGFGLLERDGGSLYDTALLLSPNGNVHLKYRRVHPQWHGKHADPAIYRQGVELQKTETDFGSVVFLICGDLWDDALIRQVRDMRPDWVLHPHGRSFADRSHDQDKWETEELPDYQRLVRAIGAPVLATSYLCIEPFSQEADTYGGAMVFDRVGRLVTSHPLDRIGILYFNPENMHWQPAEQPHAADTLPHAADA
jgi:predicted amidohydrolase